MVQRRCTLGAAVHPRDLKFKETWQAHFTVDSSVSFKLVQIRRNEAFAAARYSFTQTMATHCKKSGLLAVTDVGHGAVIEPTSQTDRLESTTIARSHELHAHVHRVRSIPEREMRATQSGSFALPQQRHSIAARLRHCASETLSFAHNGNRCCTCPVR